jgi:flagellar biosynthetic protein FliP
LIALLTVLSIAPSLLIMVTSFTRFIVALSFLRSGMGLQSTPANLVLISLALFMTFYVMAPTFDRAWTSGIQPLMKNEIGEEEAYRRITAPFRDFMLVHVRERDLTTFEQLADETIRPKADEKQIDLRIIIPAFMISELRRAFEIGFLIMLPFLVIDMIVATITMSMGMMMMPPTVIALPFKTLFFVLIDGWSLVTSGLIRSFQ